MFTFESEVTDIRSSDIDHAAFIAIGRFQKHDFRPYVFGSSRPDLRPSVPAGC